MKTTIKKKTYDTDEATFIGEWDNGYPPENALDYAVEELYMTAGHGFFIHGRGGARTAYGRYVGFDSWSGGEKIRLLPDSTARRVVREHLPEKYHEIFGDNPYFEIKDESGEAIEVGTWEQIADVWKAIKANPCEKSRLTLWEEQEDGNHQIKDEATGEGYEELNREELKSMGLDLYGSGWRADDKEELQYQYNFTDWEVETLCEILKEIEIAEDEE